MAESYFTFTFIVLFFNLHFHISYSIDDQVPVNATEALCDYGHIPCDTGPCVPRTGWCDGQVECEDASDEAYCFPLLPLATISDVKLNPCSIKHFTCDDGMCIPIVARCDDLPDCRNREDEEDCWNDDGESTSDPNPEQTTRTKEGGTSAEFLKTQTASEKNEFATRAEVVTSTESMPPSTSGEDLKTETTYAITEIVASEESTTFNTPTLITATAEDIRSTIASVSSDNEPLQKGISYLLQLRDEEWGWGESTARFATALYLTNDSYFDSHSYDGQLTKKQLEVQLALDLMRIYTRPLRIDQLENYINALLATCLDPKDFHGVNMLRMLKLEVKHLLAKGHFVNPFAYLALCNADDLSDEFISRIKNVAYRRSEEPMWLDIQAIALLTISCRTSRNNPSYSEWKIMKKDVAKNITEWQQRDGSFGSMYSTGLVLQALIAANETGTENVQAKALTYLKMHQNWEGSFGNQLDNFYVLPTLNFKSLASISERRCKTHHSGTLSTESVSHREKKQKKINVHYSLWIGGSKNEIHTLTLGVKPHTNFFEIMELAQQVNSRYKFEVFETDRGPVINSIAGRSSDVETGTYWTLYRKVPVQFRPVLSNRTSTISRLKLFGARRYIKDLKKLYPKDKEHLAFWLKPYF